MPKKSPPHQDGPNTAPTIVWLRQDLRLADQPALHEAIALGGPVAPVFIWAPEEEAPWSPGAASQVWLHQSLKQLQGELEAIGSRLLLFDGRKTSSLTVLQALSQSIGARAVFWNRRYEPCVIERDKKIKAQLKSLDLTVSTFNGALLVEPWTVETKQGNPYQVFTPFWRACQMQIDVQQTPPLPRPRTMPMPEALHKLIDGLDKTVLPLVDLDSLRLLPRIAWDSGIKESWQPGEKGALKQLNIFLHGALSEYKEGRDLPAREGVSRMSPHLHFGEISPRTICYAVQKALEENKSTAKSGSKVREAGQAYIRELGWREFAHHILYYFPHTTDAPLRDNFARFPWAQNKEVYSAWTRGLTGYPIVDAGMRELWHTGIMHNRVRMIAASFLVKDLLIPWQSGARWFWQTLVDADLAQNSLGWQWTAGCGADAAPYFRIFNPVLQGEKFDPDGSYVRRWVPELAALPNKWIHKPWLAPPLELASCGVCLGENYPLPIVDHSQARDRALAAFKQLKENQLQSI